MTTSTDLEAAVAGGAVHHNETGYYFLEPGIFYPRTGMVAAGNWVKIGDTSEEAASYLARPLPERVLKSVVDDTRAMPAETRAAASDLLAGRGTTYQRLLVLRFLEVEARDGEFCPTSVRGWQPRRA